MLAGAACLVAPPPAQASDHADPVAVPGLKELFDNGVPSAAAADKLGGNITDLFVFPLDAGNHPIDFLPPDGSAPAADPTLTPAQNQHRAEYARCAPEQRALHGQPYELTAAERARIKALAVIFDVRRSLTKNDKLHLAPFVYRVFFDLHSRVLFDAGEDPLHFKPSELARYGGSIPEPEKILPDVTLEFRLNDDATLKQKTLTGLANEELIQVYTGIRDDPFIFPTFNTTDVVAMVVIIPLRCFPAGQQDWLAWCTTTENGRQVDHDGRSLRTQNPRLDMLNTLPPSQHVAAVKAAMDHPSLVSELALKFKIQGMFQYRPWDLFPDVMIYSTRFNVGFPNGRRLADDVASLLAQNGDTLLFENSYLKDAWPRVSVNNKPFLADFPYLAEPNNAATAPADYAITTRNKFVIAGILVVVALGLFFMAYGVWQFIQNLRARKPFPG